VFSQVRTGTAECTSFCTTLFVYNNSRF